MKSDGVYHRFRKPLDLNVRYFVTKGVAQYFLFGVRFAMGAFLFGQNST